jgi:3-hydroxy-9,10-secoandrosta-1,3,5(10)-triene-9,17-dione monooxygenase reductase component
MISSEPPSTVTPAAMRSILGHFPSGITIITALTPTGPAGLTCQSFSSLSLDPPLVLVLPARSSASWPAIQRSGRFCVNVLGRHQEDLSNRFARSGGDKFDGVTWTRSPLGSPVLDRAAAAIDCTIEDVVDGGDHLIVVGAVHGLDADRACAPLLYHRGRYAHLCTGDCAAAG